MQPYYLKMLTKQIKVCKGCRLGYGNEVSVPDPTYNICVAHEESIVLPSAAYATKTVAHYHAAPFLHLDKRPNIHSTCSCYFIFHCF